MNFSFSYLMLLFSQWLT